MGRYMVFECDTKGCDTWETVDLPPASGTIKGRREGWYHPSGSGTIHCPACRVAFFDKGKQRKSSNATVQRMNVEPVLEVGPLKQYNDNLERRYPGLYARLGLESDISLAKEYSLSRERIRQFRAYNSIMKCKEPPPPYAHLLGTMPDKRLAETLGESPSKIARLRRGLKIPAFSGRDMIWRDAMRDRLGKESDMALSLEFDVAVSGVVKWRNELGIAPFRERKRYPEETKAECVKLYSTGRYSREEVAKMIGIPPHVVVQATKHIKNVKRPSNWKKNRSPLAPTLSAREIKKEIRRLRKLGHTRYAIANHLGVKYSVVSYYTRDLHGTGHKNKVEEGT